MASPVTHRRGLPVFNGYDGDVGILRRIFSKGWIGFLLVFWLALLLWIRSGRMIDVLTYDAASGKNGAGHLGIYLASGEGKISFKCDGASYLHSYGFHYGKISVREMKRAMAMAHPFRQSLEPGSMEWHLGPFGLGIWRWQFKLLMPYWFILLLSGIWPAQVFRRWWRWRKRMARGCCVACGYDLRASSGRCPECGANKPSKTG